MQHHLIESKAFRSHGYENGVMEVCYHRGKIYSHPGVPPELYQQFLAAKSRGEFFGRHIRAQFPGKLLGLETKAVEANISTPAQRKSEQGAESKSAIPNSDRNGC